MAASIVEYGVQFLVAVRKNDSQLLTNLVGQDREFAKKCINEYKDDIGRSIFMIGCSKNSVEAIDILLQLEDIDVNVPSSKSGQTALMIAAGKGFFELVEKLVCDNRTIVDSRSFDGWSALFFCVINGHTKVAQYLLDKNADANQADAQGQTPLMLASYAGHAEMVDTLLDSGALVNSESLSGYTCLMRAAEKGHIDVMQKLITAGAHIHLETKNKKTALQLAINNNHIEAIDLLISNGAFPTAYKEFPELTVKKSSVDNSPEKTKTHSNTPQGITELSPEIEEDKDNRQMASDPNENEFRIAYPVLNTFSPIMSSSPNKILYLDHDMEQSRSSSMDGSHGKSMDGQSVFA